MGGQDDESGANIQANSNPTKRRNLFFPSWERIWTKVFQQNWEQERKMSPFGEERFGREGGKSFVHASGEKEWNESFFVKGKTGTNNLEIRWALELQLFLLCVIVWKYFWIEVEDPNNSILILEVWLSYYFILFIYFYFL